MRRLKEHLPSLVLSLVEAAVGVLLLIDPLEFTEGIIRALGICLVLFGASSAAGYFHAPPEEAAMQQKLAIGVGAILLGLFCVFRSGWFMVTFPVLSVLYGLFLLGSGIGKVQWAVDLLRLGRKFWFLAGINAAISLICAAVILKNPVEAATFMWILTAVVLLAAGVMDLCTIFFGQKEKDAPIQDED